MTAVLKAIIMNQALSVVPAPASDIILYLTVNHRLIHRKKYGLLLHHRKVTKALPTYLAADFLNLDVVSDAVSSIDDTMTHDIVSAGITAMKFYLMCI